MTPQVQPASLRTATMLIRVLTLALTSVTSVTLLDSTLSQSMGGRYYSYPAAKATRIRESEPEPGNLKVDLKGQVVFGGLFPMHEKGTQGRNCGKIKKEKGIQRLEAMLLAVDLINRDPNLLPGVTVGMRILDTCSYDTFALEQCMDFIKAQLSTIDLEDYRCEDNSSPAYNRLKPVVGVIGAASSTVSIMVANILRLFKIPQISYASTSSDLSDKGRFEYFSRVVPPDTYQAQAMVDIAKRLQWNYVNTIAEAGTYGEKGIEAFKEAAKKSGVCLAESKIIPRNAEDSHYESIIQALLDRGNPAKVGVMFANEDNCRRLVKALVRLNRTQDLKLLASDSWGAKIHPVYGQEEAAVGTITILVKRKDIKAFDDYFLNLTLRNNHRNPWFPEFWEATFNCSVHGGGVKRKCSGEERLRDVTGYKQEGLVQFVMDAVLSLAQAVNDSLSDHCPQGFDRCPHLRNMTGERFLRYIRNVSFIGTGGEPVMFTANGDGLGRYDIYQYQRTEEGKYVYARIGEWTDRLVLDVDSLQWKNGSRGLPPVSICSQPCKPGESRKSSSQCCWICAPCKDNEFLKDEETCHLCDHLSKPDANRTGCVRLPEIYLDFYSFWFLIPAVFCLCGVVSTGFVLVVFIRYNNTPVIMASGRELCYILLLGIFLAYFTALLMLLTPSPVLCAVIRLGVGVSLCFIYAGLLTKTNRIYRIFNVGIKAMVKRPSYTSPRSQILICTCLVSVQVVGGLTWLGFEKPATEYRLHNKDYLVRECRCSQVATMISLFYNMFLIVLCTVYAFKTRNIPQNFNEAKYIAFAMYSTCIVWCAFIPIYFGANHDFRIEVTSLCMCVAISATVSLFCLFAPKVYIVVFQPHKNVRQATNPTSLSSTGKTLRSFYGCSSAFPIPMIQNGSCSLQRQGLVEEESRSLRDPAAAGGEGGKADSKVEVLNAFHDSMEDLSSGGGGDGGGATATGHQQTAPLLSLDAYFPLYTGTEEEEEEERSHPQGGSGSGFFFAAQDDPGGTCQDPEQLGVAGGSGGSLLGFPDSGAGEEDRRFSSRLGTASRVSDSNLDRRHGENSLQQFGETRFGSCDNTTKTFMTGGDR
ncbi:metabotropic glutamate receptor 8-like [Babylonia areolata]|uniref:metabotropic glutamate receptor 8-like n=1 Tax=Babylonia areolata TaxID=304850 RepID=UPI003FD54FFA